MVLTSRLAVVLLVTTLAACGVRQLGAAPQVMPLEAHVRRDSLRDFGQRLFEGLREGSLSASFASATELEAIVAPEARFRVERGRATSADGRMGLSRFQQDWGDSSFAGFCAQGARDEPAGRSLGLAQPGWVLDRILVVARNGASGPRSASWLEGDFVYTARGWRALIFRRIEAPRHQHSDLELAPCDVEAGLH